MKDRIALHDLRVEEFIHEKELALQQSVVNSPEVKKLIAMVSDVNLRLNKTRIQGTYIHLTDKTHPKLFVILEDVCRILGHSRIPELYVCKLMSSTVLPCVAETEYIVMADYVLQTYDEDMLYFAFGNAVTMIMAGHVKMTTAAAYMGCNIWTALPQLKFKEYLHAADATSDRGGLLACQSLAAAARRHFLELGIPPALTRRWFSTDEETAQYIEKYLLAVAEKNHFDRSLTRLGEWWSNMNTVEAAANTMLLDLYLWYKKEYHGLLDRHRTEVTP